jgi:hypothetical protein
MLIVESFRLPTLRCTTRMTHGFRLGTPAGNTFFLVRTPVQVACKYEVHPLTYRRTSLRPGQTAALLTETDEEKGRPPLRMGCPCDARAKTWLEDH